MPLLRDRIIRRNSERFESYKKKSLEEVQVTHPQLYTDFLEQKESLRELLRETKYWHGTGRYQYVHHGDSKYEGVLHSDTKDVLRELCAQGGLQPHYDPWFEKYVHTPMSISLANQWCYGKMYAHYHLDEKKSLQYEIAPVSFWYHVLIWIQLTENYCKFMFGFLILYTFSSALQQQGKKWMATYRSDLDKKWPFWEILTAQSDISGNYGMFLGIKDEIVSFEIPKIVRFMETRTTDVIPFSKMCFVAVPYENVSETEEILTQHQVSLPVVPLEFIELFMSDFTLHDLEYQSYRN